MYVRCCGGGLCWGASSMIVLMVVVEYTTGVVTLLCMCIIVCGVDVIIFNAIERYVSCVMVVRVGPRSMEVDGCMLVPVCIVFVFRICVYDVVCLYIGVAYVHAYVRICMWV